MVGGIAAAHDPDTSLVLPEVAYRSQCCQPAQGQCIGQQATRGHGGLGFLEREGPGLLCCPGQKA